MFKYQRLANFTELQSHIYNMLQFLKTRACQYKDDAYMEDLMKYDYNELMKKVQLIKRCGRLKESEMLLDKECSSYCIDLHNISLIDETFDTYVILGKINYALALYDDFDRVYIEVDYFDKDSEEQKFYEVDPYKDYDPDYNKNQYFKRIFYPSPNTIYQLDKVSGEIISNGLYFYPHHVKPLFVI